MGYAHYIDQRGQEAGYGVDAVCEHPDCDAVIDRGLAYRCGGAEDAGCHGFFCAGHLVYRMVGDHIKGPQLCPLCAAAGSLTVAEQDHT
ncbi:MAG: hypothetical protein KY469_10695 [Actinobacteria bacterium]|nr:hypothetical protein [Actinomycetota bacterium]